MSQATKAVFFFAAAESVCCFITVQKYHTRGALPYRYTHITAAPVLHQEARSRTCLVQQNIQRNPVSIIQYESGYHLLV